MNARTVGYAIAVSALLITIPRYIAVLQDIDDWSITAWGMGILLGGGAAYIFHTWARTKRQHAGRLLVAFGANLLYEPIIVTPFVLARLWDMELAQVMSLGYAVFWALMVATAPIVLAGGVVLALSFQKERRESKPTANTSKLTCAQCKREFAWPSPYANRRAAQNAMNAHRCEGGGNNGKRRQSQKMDSGNSPGPG